jgi:hypothetical protein
MTFFVAWLVFPILLGLLSLGCGLLLEQVAGLEIPAALLLPLGFVVVSLATLFAHMTGRTAGLAAPLVVVLALVGFGLSLPGRSGRLDAWLVATGTAVYAAFAAPTLLTGRATFLGYIKLDDTATYLAMLDRATRHGYDTTGLGPSTYEALLDAAYVNGYPLGSLLPLGAGSTLVREDVAWLWQPYLTFLAVLVGLALYQLVSDLIRRRALRALVAFIGAQAALAYGYALWGGVKELFTTAIVATMAALVPLIVGHERVRAVLPMAAASAALVAALSIGGAAWLAAPLAVAALLLARSAGVRRALRLSLAFLAATALFALPELVTTGRWLSNSGISTVATADEYGNLIRRLSWIQVFGIWPHGDFRTPPKSLAATYVLVGVVAVGATVALWFAWKRRSWTLPVAVGSAAFACVVYGEKGSPWIAGKALASASPIVLAAGLAGAALVFERGRRTEAIVAAVAVIAAVVWSNVLQYHDVYVAPSGRLTELESIGNRFAGQGPTLLTEFDPYGARHFLRRMDAESTSELRRHYVTLRTGQVAEKGSSPDLDEIQLDAVLHYPTLVVRRSGISSRPPSGYSLVSSGRYYQVWQRPVTKSRIIEHLSLGSRMQPVAVPSCGDVLRLGRLAAANGGVLATVERPPAIVIGSEGTIGAPTSFAAYGEYRDALYAPGSSVDAAFDVPSTGRYRVWVGGSFRTRVGVSIDDRAVGSARDVLQWPGNFVEIGDEPLAAGPHTFRLTFGTSDLGPGSGGPAPWGLGPFAVAEGTQDRPVTYVEPSRARSLCGRSLDWIEALRAPGE